MIQLKFYRRLSDNMSFSSPVQDNIISVIIAAMLFLLIPAPSPALTSLPSCPEDFTLRRQEAVEQARRGEINESLSTLELLSLSCPEDLAILRDLIIILGWAKRDAEAVIQARPLMEQVDQEPAWLLRSLAGSCRNIGDYEQAIALYRELDRRHPNDFWSRATLIKATAEAGFLDESLDMARQALQDHGRKFDILFAYGYVYEKRISNFLP